MHPSPTPSGAVSENAAFILPAAMTVETVDPLADELRQWLPVAEKCTAVLDASQVETITTPGMQLLIALQKSLAANGSALAVRGGRPVFLHAFRDAGLESVLGS